MATFDPEHEIWKVRREFGEHGGVVPSVARSSTFTVMEPSSMREIFQGLKGPEHGGCYLYSRHFNPTIAVLARYLAAMEGTGAAWPTGSGMAAISSTLLQLCKSGDHIVSGDSVYGGTHALMADVFPDMGIDVTFVDATNPAAFEAAIRPETRVLYAETFGNPLLKVADIPALSRIAKPRGITLVVDNTFTPMMVTPALLGADITVHSLTKYINGASDLIGGVICAAPEFIAQLMDLHKGRLVLLGPTMDPRAAFDVIQRLPHLAMRMREHGKRAMAMAELLSGMGVAVGYPGLKNHPQHALFQQIANPGFGAGGIFTVDCGTLERAENFLDILQNRERFGLLAVSLGFYDTLMSCSGASTSSEIPEEEQRKMGLSPGLVRLSVGYTGAFDARLAQLERAVRAAGLAA